VKIRILALLFLSLAGVRAQENGQRLEAHTPASDTSRVVVSPRIFTAPELDSLIEAGNHVDSLIIYPPRIYVTEGGSFELNQLYLVALDAMGQRVYRAPLRIEVASFNASLGTERLMGFREGQTSLRITSLLPRKGGETSVGVEIDVFITPWPN